MKRILFDKIMLQFKQKNSKKNLSFFIYAILVVLFLFISISSLKAGVDTYFYAQNGKNAILLGQKYIKAQDLSKSALALKTANVNFVSAQKSFKKLSWIKFFPFISVQYRAGDKLINGAVLITSSLSTVVDVGQSTLASAKLKDIKNIGGLDTKQKRKILQNLYQSAPIIARAKSQIDLAEIELSEIPKFGVLLQIKKYKSQVDENFPQLKSAVDGLYIASKTLPNLAGYPQEQIYFFMFQNNTELRATGGFFGTYGILRVKDGEIKQLKTNDPYNLDNRAKINVTPPWQLPTLANPQMKSWYLRDANWFPDFPTSAEKAIWFFHEEGGKENFNGVISITPTFIEYLLKITGPIKVEGFPQEFTSENVVDLIQYQVEKRFVELGLREEYRKNIIGELAQIIIKRIFELPKEKIPDLLKIFNDSLLEKQLLLYFKNLDAQKFVEEKNWGGRIIDSELDYIFPVDSNMASLKTDEYVKRYFDYSIDFSKGDQANVKLNLTYKNEAPGFSWKTTRYRNWNRIYVPEGSELIGISGNEEKREYYNGLAQNYEIMNEFGKTSFGTFISIEPGDQETLTYEYKLPRDLTKKLRNNGYKLYFQKQGGTIKPGLKITVTTDKNVKTFAPNFGNKIDDKKIEFNWDLNQDREINLEF